MSANAVMKSTDRPEWLSGVERACAAIAPNWPLDRQVAVNPLWEQRHLSFQEASARWSALGGFRCLMPARWYRDQWLTSIHPAHLRQAAQEMNVGMPPQELVAALENESSPPVLRLFSACLDQDRQGLRELP